MGVENVSNGRTHIQKSNLFEIWYCFYLTDLRGNMQLNLCQQNKSCTEDTAILWLHTIWSSPVLLWFSTTAVGVIGAYFTDVSVSVGVTSDASQHETSCMRHISWLGEPVMKLTHKLIGSGYASHFLRPAPVRPSVYENMSIFLLYFVFFFFLRTKSYGKTSIIFFYFLFRNCPLFNTWSGMPREACLPAYSFISCKPN